MSQSERLLIAIEDDSDDVNERKVAVPIDALEATVEDTILYVDDDKLPDAVEEEKEEEEGEEEEEDWGGEGAGIEQTEDVSRRGDIFHAFDGHSYDDSRGNWIPEYDAEKDVADVRYSKQYVVNVDDVLLANAASNWSNEVEDELGQRPSNAKAKALRERSCQKVVEWLEKRANFSSNAKELDLNDFDSGKKNPKSKNDQTKNAAAPEKGKTSRFASQPDIVAISSGDSFESDVSESGTGEEEIWVSKRRKGLTPFQINILVVVLACLGAILGIVFIALFSNRPTYQKLPPIVKSGEKRWF